MLTLDIIRDLYSLDELCAVLRHAAVPYGYSHTKSGLMLQQSKDVMAWQVLDMVAARKVMPLDNNNKKHGRVIVSSTSGHHMLRRSRSQVNMKRFDRKETTNVENALKSLKLQNAGRTMRDKSRHAAKGRKEVGISVCPVCKGTGASGKVWYVTAPVRKAGTYKPSVYMKVTPAQRRMALRTLALKKEEAAPQLDDIADRREDACGVWDLLIPYLVGLVVGIFCVITIARVVRNFTPVRTVEWAASSVISLVLSWVFTDPLKVVVLTPWAAYKKHRKIDKKSQHKSRAHAKMQGALFLLKSGAAKPMDFRKAGRSVISLNNALGAAQKKMLTDAVQQKKEKIRAELAAVQRQEEADFAARAARERKLNRGRSVANMQDKRAELREKQMAQRASLERNLRKMDDDLHLVLADQHEKFQSQAGDGGDGGSRPGRAGHPDADEHAAHTESLMSNYNAEAEHLKSTMVTKAGQQQAALQAKIAEKRRIMAERVASVECLLNVHSTAVEDALKAKAEEKRKDEEAEMKKQMDAQIAQMEKVLWANRHKAGLAAANKIKTKTQGSGVGSLSDDLKSLKKSKGMAVREADPESVELALKESLGFGESDEKKLTAAQRWKQARAWQARVSKLTSMPAISKAAAQAAAAATQAGMAGAEAGTGAERAGQQAAAAFAGAAAKSSPSVASGPAVTFAPTGSSTQSADSVHDEESPRAASLPRPLPRPPPGAADANSVSPARRFLVPAQDAGAGAADATKIAIARARKKLAAQRRMQRAAERANKA